MPLPKRKPDTTSPDHAQCKLGLQVFSENEGKLHGELYNYCMGRTFLRRSLFQMLKQSYM